VSHNRPIRGDAVFLEQLAEVGRGLEPAFGLGRRLRCRPGLDRYEQLGVRNIHCLGNVAMTRVLLLIDTPELGLGTHIEDNDLRFARWRPGLHPCRPDDRA